MKKNPLRLSAAAITFGALMAATGTALPPIPAAAQTATTQVVAAQTETFAIENMTCALCPVTVKKAMESVNGVKSVSVNFDAKTATVVFDPAVTDPDTIAAASTSAGYPAAVKG